MELFRCSSAAEDSGFAVHADRFFDSCCQQGAWDCFGPDRFGLVVIMQVRFKPLCWRATSSWLLQQSGDGRQAGAFPEFLFMVAARCNSNGLLTDPIEGCTCLHCELVLSCKTILKMH